MTENYEWFLEADLDRYAGQWLAIVDKKVVASGADVEKVIREAREKNPKKIPFIAKMNNRLSVFRN